MASWGTNRRNLIIFIIFAILISVGGLVTGVFYYEESTCFDEKQNGLESGIDCGGSCQLLCSNQLIEPIVQWNRHFEVVPGIYNVLAYVENPNPTAGSERAEYVFKLFNRENVQLAERNGSIEINPKEVIPIIETNLNTGELIPFRSTFEFTNNIVWEKKNPTEKVLVIRDENLSLDDGLPEITAEVFNSSIQAIKNIAVLVIVYDINDNAIASSRTFVDSLGKDQSKNIIFTWPSPFQTQYSRFEIIPLYDSSN